MELEILYKLKQLKPKLEDRVNVIKKVDFTKEETILMDEGYRQIMLRQGLKRQPPKNCGSCSTVAKAVLNYLNSLYAESEEQSIAPEDYYVNVVYKELHQLAKDKGFEGKKRSRESLIEYIKNN